MIRTASIEDYPALVAVWESAVLATHDFLVKDYFHFIKSRLSIYFQQVDLYVYTNDDENVIRGFIGVSEDKLEMLFIDNDYRGKGIGKILLKFAIDKLGITKVDVNEQNIQALDFYRHFGFTKYAYSEKDSEGKDYLVIHLSL